MRYEEQVEVEKKKLAGFGNKGEEAIYVLAISCGPRNYSYISRIEEPIELEPGGLLRPRRCSENSNTLHPVWERSL